MVAAVAVTNTKMVEQISGSDRASEIHSTSDVPSISPSDFDSMITVPDALASEIHPASATLDAPQSILALKPGDFVGIRYSVVDANTGRHIDDNLKARAPLRFTLGADEVVHGLDRALLGARLGDSLELFVAPDEGYGSYDEAKVRLVPRREFKGIELERGMILYAEDESGAPRQTRVLEVLEDMVSIDYNHPLADVALIFSVEVVEASPSHDLRLDSHDAAKHAHNDGKPGCCGKHKGGCKTHAH